jgi:hypothetical protein
MKYSVDEVKEEKDKNIVIRLSGDDLSYLVQNGKLSIYLDEKIADSIAWHIQTILEDRKRCGRK